MKKYLVYTSTLIVMLSSVQTYAMVTQPQSFNLIPKDRAAKKPYRKANKGNLASLFMHSIFPKIQQELLDKGIDLSGHTNDQPTPMAEGDIDDYISSFNGTIDLNGTIGAIELTDKKIASMTAILDQASVEAAFFFDYDDVLNVPDSASRNHHILFDALKRAKDRGARIYIFSSGSKFCKNLKEENFKKGFSRNPFLENTITTPIHIPETFTNNQILELAGKNIKIQKTKAGNMLNAKGKREYSDAASDIDVLCMTYLDDPVELSYIPENGKKPILIFSRGAITSSSILEYKGRRGSTITDDELLQLTPAAKELDEPEREALKAVLCDAPIKGNSFPVILDFLFKTDNLKGVKKIIFVDDSEHKVLGAKAGFIYMKEKGFMALYGLTHALAVRFCP